MKKSPKKAVVRPVRWPIDFGEDFDERLKDTVSRLNKLFGGKSRFNSLSLNRYIANAVRNQLAKDNKLLDRPRRS